ncbi:MAG TPA: 50S ribosomal protein L6 [Acidobacteriota bacterium]|nr:50S ribosomal protein L6 [Acidobacteriota bacterium]
MSRIGKKLIPVPTGVNVRVEETSVAVEGPKGRLTVPVPAGIEVEQQDGVLRVKRLGDEKELRAKHGLTGALLANAVRGVREGWVRKLDVVGIGYRAEVRGRFLSLNLGHSHPIEIVIPDGLEISVEREPRTVQNYVVTISVAGSDRYLVGQVAANIRALRPPDPYKGKGVRYSDEVVRLKAGKKGA